DEIIERLGMRHPLVIVRGFDRPNIFLRVATFPTEAAKRDAVLERVQDAPKPGIVYAGTRRHVEEIAQALIDRGVNAASYHAGMSATELHESQNAFMPGGTDAVVA